MRIEFKGTDSMDQKSTIDTETLTDLSQKTEEIVGLFNQYGGQIFGSLFILMGGIIAIYLIHKIAAKFLFPHFHKGKLIKVTGVAVYALILIATASMVFISVGVDVVAISHIALSIMFFLSVLIFFLLPFLPKLPFQIGHLVEIRGELGTVTAVSPLFTRLEKSDGTLVFVPNTSILSMTIKNYSHISSRRIEINLSVRHGSDLVRAKAVCIRLMSEDGRVLDEPSPPAVFVINANTVGVELLIVCWAKNEDWFSTQSDLWEKIVNTFSEDILQAKPPLQYAPRGSEHSTPP
jgi:small conductance mechanosensitive channel